MLSVPGRIDAFAADGAELAWMQPLRRGCAVVFRRAAGGTTRRVRVRGACPFDGTGRWLALAGKRAVWATATSGNFSVTTVETGARGSARGTVLGRLEVVPGSHEELVRGAAGNGSTLVYAVSSIVCNEDENGVTTCALDPGGAGGIWRVVGARDVRVRPEPAAAVAAAGRTVGVVPASATELASVVELRDARTGALRRRIHAGAAVYMIGLSDRLLAAATRDSREVEGLKLFDARAGASLGSVETHATALAVSGMRVVFVTGRTIRLVDARTKRVLVLAARRRPIVGLAVEQGRILWAENAGGRGRVYTLKLPR